MVWNPNLSSFTKQVFFEHSDVAGLGLHQGTEWTLVSVFLFILLLHHIVSTTSHCLEKVGGHENHVRKLCGQMWQCGQI